MRTIITEEQLNHLRDLLAAEAEKLDAHENSGEIIRLWREFRGYSQREAARRFQIQPVLLSRYENGHCRPRGLGALVVALMRCEIITRGDAHVVPTGYYFKPKAPQNSSERHVRRVDQASTADSRKSTPTQNR